MPKAYIGIDNGVTGSLGIITDNYSKQIPTPVKKEQSYTKAKQNITRIQVNELETILKEFKDTDCLIVLERPMVNPGRFKATVSALRALEATLCTIEQLELPYLYIDSKEWQKNLLPKGVKGAPALKQASHDKGKQLFPYIKQKGDYDGILIAYYAKINNL